MGSSRERAIRTKSMWACICVLTLGSCAPRAYNATPCLSEDLLELASRHYRANNSEEVLKLAGGKLDFIIDDLETHWEMSVSPSGFAGGDTMMSIRKQDMRVEMSPIRGQ